jgi:uracil-DNA glycosylase family 4
MAPNEAQLAILNQQVITCRRCPRLVAWREAVAQKKRRAYLDWEYWEKPVPGFGDPQARILVIGLAPGAHGSNRTGRIFTGDDSGVFLYRALFKAGFANQPSATHIGDGLKLKDMYISAVCRCVPPDNRPTLEEVSNCRPFLAGDLALLDHVQGIVLLGRIAMDGLIHLYRSQGINLPRVEFGHARFHQLEGNLPWWITSYHPSRQNTQTGRLTEAMFDEVWLMAKQHLG